jgi:hypothetical protein
MDAYYFNFGWCLLLVAAIFAVGLVPKFAPWIYPGNPGFLGRLAAPAIFGLLATACFFRLGQVALWSVVVLGLSQISISRWRKRRSASAV